MTDLALDPARSTVRLHTFAEGMLARLAHDLEIVCGGLTGKIVGRNGTTGTATVDAPLKGFAVAGTLGKDGKVDERGLSPGDRRDCLAKMHHDVFHARPDGVVRVEAHTESGTTRVRIVPPNGKAVEVVLRPEVVEEAGGAVRARGVFDVSLAAIGSDVVKGPMGAFRVKDLVRVSFDVVFAPQPA